jgi:pimeloyl-ACP methyl ester carboxylesterase
VVLAAPLLGRRLVADEHFTTRAIKAVAVRREAWSADDLRSFTAVLAEPARARASPLLYRTFLLREAGRTPGGPLPMPTRIMIGAGDPAVRPFLLQGAEREADGLVVEIVPVCGHFVPEERPALVAERTGTFRVH